MFRLSSFIFSCPTPSVGTSKGLLFPDRNFSLPREHLRIICSQRYGWEVEESLVREKRLRMIFLAPFGRGDSVKFLELAAHIAGITVAGLFGDV